MQINIYTSHVRISSLFHSYLLTFNYLILFILYFQKFYIQENYVLYITHIIIILLSLYFNFLNLGYRIFKPKKRV